MSSGTSLFESESWYDFVSNEAVKDEQLQQSLKEYMKAHAALTNRIAELVDANPNINVTIQRVADGNMSGGVIKQIQEYHARHGKQLSAEEVCQEAQAEGYQIAHVV